MLVFRLTKKKYASDLNGRGAARSNNRWNSKGVEMIYTAESRALAMAEVAVHLSFAILPADYQMMEIEIPDSMDVEFLDLKKLNKDWDHFPPTGSTQKLGDHFIESLDKCILKVPSAVVKGDFNILINPYHKDFKKIRIKKVTEFLFDKRLFT